MIEMHNFSPTEYREYHRYILRDFGQEREIDLRCCPSYQGFQRAWMPQMHQTTRNLGLFIVRFPPITKSFQIRWHHYQELMRMRVQWMIFKWMEKSGEDKAQTYQRLEETLYRLNPNATPPDFANYPGWEWAEFWGDCLIRHNKTWTILFQQNSELDFPIDILPANSPSQELVEIHDSVYLDQFLSELACSKSI